MPTAVIVDAIRTPLGRRNGKLKDVHPVDLAAHVLQTLVERNDVDPALVEDVIMGCVMQVGEQGINIGRNAALAAGFPETTVGTTIDRQCGSSQQAAHFAAQGVMAGAYDVVIAAGVESMTRVPMGASVADGKYGFPFGPMMTGRYPNLVPAGHLGRADRREVGHHPRGQRRVLGAVAPARGAGDAKRAASTGRSCRSTVPTESGDEVVRQDEGIRPDSSMETLAKLKPAFKPDGVVTAAQLVADHRRRGRGADHERGEGEPARPQAPGPLPHVRARGRRPGADAHRPDPGHDQGARAGEDDARPDGPRRDQRGVRPGRALVGEGAPPRHVEGQRQRRRDRPRSPARLLRAPGSWPRC